jgi:hypothetical protein
VTLACYLDGVGLLGPGLANWRDGRAVLSGDQPHHCAATILPTPQLLPPAERRRTGRVVKLALAVALEASEQALVDHRELASVFTSSGADGYVCHDLCQALAEPAREVSPTRFANSVHNAASGYWSIATGAVAESNVLCAHDVSLVAGLLEAMTQVCVDTKPVLMVGYETEYPSPLHEKRPIPDALGIALVLCPTRGPRSLARLELQFVPPRPADELDRPSLEDLRRTIPAARGLPILALLARGQSGAVVLDYLGEQSVRVRVEPLA